MVKGVLLLDTSVPDERLQNTRAKRSQMRRPIEDPIERLFASARSITAGVWTEVEAEMERTTLITRASRMRS